MFVSYIIPIIYENKLQPLSYSFQFPHLYSTWQNCTGCNIQMECYRIQEALRAQAAKSQMDEWIYTMSKWRAKVQMPPLTLKVPRSKSANAVCRPEGPSTKCADASQIGHFWVFLSVPGFRAKCSRVFQDFGSFNFICIFTVNMSVPGFRLSVPECSRISSWVFQSVPGFRPVRWHVNRTDLVGWSKCVYGSQWIS